MLQATVLWKWRVHGCLAQPSLTLFISFPFTNAFKSCSLHGLLAILASPVFCVYVHISLLCIHERVPFHSYAPGLFPGERWREEYRCCAKHLRAVGVKGAEANVRKVLSDISCCCWGWLPARCLSGPGAGSVHLAWLELLGCGLLGGCHFCIISKLALRAGAPLVLP